MREQIAGLNDYEIELSINYLFNFVQIAGKWNIVSAKL